MPAQDPSGAPFQALLKSAPQPHDVAGAQTKLDDLLQEASSSPELSRLPLLVAAPAVKALLLGVFGSSPYLTQLIRQDPARLIRLLECAPSPRLEARCAALAASITRSTNVPAPYVSRATETAPCNGLRPHSTDFSHSSATPSTWAGQLLGRRPVSLSSGDISFITALTCWT